MKRGCFIALLGSCVIAGAARADGLKLVPSDALAFAHVRAAELWKSPLMAEMRQVIELAGPEAAQVIEKRFVPSPSQLESATLIVFPPTGGPPEVVVAFGFTEAIDRDRFAAAASKDGDVPPHRWLDDQTLIVGEEDQIERFRMPTDRDGPMSQALKGAAKHHAVVAVNFAALPEEALQEVPPPFRPVFKARMLTFHLDLGKQLRADLRMSYASPAGAEDAEKAVKMGIGVAQQQLGEGRQEMLKMLRGDPDKYPSPLGEMPEALGGLVGLGALNQLDQMLEKVPLKRDGTDLALNVTLDAEDSRPGAGTVAIAVGLLLPAVQKVREAAARMQSQNNLKQIALAFHNYHSAYDRLPSAAIVDKNGKPLLSWRVTILPYIDQVALYERFKLDEPWDSEHNLKLVPLMPQVYHHPFAPPPGEGRTYYRVAVGDPSPKGGQGLNTAFDQIQGRRLLDITDGTSNSWMAFEAAESVIWSKPEPLVCEPGKPLPELGRFFSEGTNVAFCDGSVRFFRMPIDEARKRAYLSINGGEVIPFEE